MNMFCYQCEQTAGGRGCEKQGVCGKDATTAALQDLLLYAAKGISQYATRARLLGTKSNEVDVFVIEALFTTVTNVSFDATSVEAMVRKAATVKKNAQALYEHACSGAGKQPEKLEGPAQWSPAATQDGLLTQAASIGIASARSRLGDDLAGLQELLTYGLKGFAAYADHARKLGKEDDKVYAFMHEALDYLTQPNPTVDKLFALNMKCGEINLAVMEMLDAAHTGTYGNPVPTQRARHPGQGQGDPRLRPRPEGPAKNCSSRPQGNGHQRLHPRGDAARPRLSGAEEVQRISWATTAAPGRIRQRNSTPSRAPSS